MFQTCHDFVSIFIFCLHLLALEPSVRTATVSQDPDDPAIWVNKANPAASLILGTNKAKAPEGALVVFDLTGRKLFTFDKLDRPNNVDIAYQVQLGGKRVDLAIVTERFQQRLRVFTISPGGTLTDVSGATRVFEGETGDAASPMGVAIYRRPRDQATFAIVSRKTGPSGRYLWQYRLDDDGAGKVRLGKVREFGAFSGQAEIEAVAVDQQYGSVFYSDENCCVRKYHADPDHRDAATELMTFARTGFTANREGIAIYAKGRRAGYVIVTDQKAGGSDYHVFDRKPPHREVTTLRGGADSTDGLDATSVPLGAVFPKGLLVAMNSSGKNFLIYRWDQLGIP